MKTINKYLLLIFSFFMLNHGVAQENLTDSTLNTKVYSLIKKSDGNELYGYIIRVRI